ncbi:IPT/TIG domain-containing protein, partial [Variibacter gotjawalensis]
MLLSFFLRGFLAGAMAVFLQFPADAQFLAPTVTSIGPVSGPTIGGTAVTLTGTNLFGAAVTFDGIPALSVSILSSTSVLAVAPPHAAGAVTVAATTLAGTASLTNAYTYVAAAPTLT